MVSTGNSGQMFSIKDIDVAATPALNIELLEPDNRCSIVSEHPWSGQYAGTVTCGVKLCVPKLQISF